MRFLGVSTSGLCWASVLCVVACSGDSFRAAPTNTGGSAGEAGIGGGAAGSGGVETAGSAGVSTAGTGGTDPQGGTSGSAGAESGGNGGNAAGGSGGSGGGAAGMDGGGSAGIGGGEGGAAGSTSKTCVSSAACPADEYCNRETKACVSCTDLSRMVLGTPIGLLGGKSIEGYFPRVAKVGGTFFLTYRFGADAPKGEIYAAAATTEAFADAAITTAKLPDPISLGDSHESGMFVLDGNTKGTDFGAVSAGMGDGAFRFALFDSDRGEKVAGSPRRRLYVARLAKEGQPAAPLVELLGPNVNGISSEGGEDTSVVYAPKTKRLYWMRSRTADLIAGQRVVTKGLGEGDAVTEITLPEPICGNGSVAFNGNFGPWVSPNGRYIFYHRGCQSAVPATAGSSIYYAELDSSGTKVVGPGKLIDTWGGVPSLATGYHRSPALSPSQCSMYFEREGKLMVAPRE